MSEFSLYGSLKKIVTDPDFSREQALALLEEYEKTDEHKHRALRYSEADMAKLALDLEEANYLLKTGNVNEGRQIVFSYACDLEAMYLK